MLTPFDLSLYPTEVTLINISGQVYYPIFKNGSSAIIKYGSRIDVNDVDFTKPISVFIRKPEDRFTSGLQTLVYNLQKSYPQLSKDTVSFLVQKYLFVDVHILPQFNWLFNLVSIVQKDVMFTLHDVKDLSLVCKIPDVRVNKDTSICVGSEVLQNLYVQLDTVIYNKVGDTLTFTNIVNDLKNDPDTQFATVLDPTVRLMKAIRCFVQD
jgi:hypothetical protein